MTLSVCIYSRSPKDLDSCLAGLTLGDVHPRLILELLVCSQDPHVLSLALTRFPEAIVGVVHGATPGGARNFLIERSTGDFLLFLDDDVLVPPGFLDRLAATIDEHPEADVIGGPNLTPPSSSTFQEIAGRVLGSIVATGGVSRRFAPAVGGPADERSLMLCNLVVRREAMLPFPPELVCAEENAVLAELSRRGSHMWYEPELFVYHQRRGNLRTFAQQMFKYGHGRGQTIRADIRVLRPQHLIPLAFLLCLAASPVMYALFPWTMFLWCAYAIIVVTTAASIAYRARDLRRWPLATLLVLVVHVFYGLGVFWGLATYRRDTSSDARWSDYRPS